MLSASTKTFNILKGSKYARKALYNADDPMKPRASIAASEGRRTVLISQVPKHTFQCMTLNVLSDLITNIAINRYVDSDGLLNIYAGKDYTNTRKLQILALIKERMDERGFICLQEVSHEFRTHPEFVALLERNGYGIVSACYGFMLTNTPPRKAVFGHLGVAVLYPLDHFEMMEYAQVGYAIAETEPNRRKFESHKFVVATFVHLRSGQMITVASVHLPFGVQDKASLIDGLKKDINDFAKGNPVLVCGDMNIDALKGDMTYIDSMMEDGYEDVLNAIRPDVVTAVASLQGTAGLQQLAVDYVSFRGKQHGMTVNPVESWETALHSSYPIPNAFFPSDHLPVEFVVSFAKQAVSPDAYERQLQCITALLWS